MASTKKTVPHPLCSYNIAFCLADGGLFLCTTGLVFFVDKVNVQTSYYFTCGFQVAWLFILVGF